MKHFNEEAWSDFARNVVPEETRMEMQQHIESGCRECAATVKVWQDLFAVTCAEGAFMPPHDAVRIVKSQFESPALRPSNGFRLVFDSALQPVTAGIRGAVAATQFLFESDDYFIDLRLEPRRAQDQNCLIGQVLKRSGRERKIDGLEVRLEARLKEGPSVLAHSSTNQLGEFELEFSITEQIYLVIMQEGSGEITLPLYGVGDRSYKQKDLDRWS